MSALKEQIVIDEESQSASGDLSLLTDRKKDERAFLDAPTGIQ